MTRAVRHPRSRLPAGPTVVGGVLAIACALALLPALPSTPAGASESAEVELRLTRLTGVLAPETGTADTGTGDTGTGDTGTADTGTADTRAGHDAGDPDAAGLAAELAADGDHPGEDLSLRLLVHNRGDEPIDGLRVVVEVHPAVESRTRLAEILDGEGEAATASVHQQDVRELGSLDPGDVAGVEEHLTPEQVLWAQDGGVHPLRISLVRGAEVLDELTTAVVWLGRTSGEPLLTTMLWPLTDTPWRIEQGEYSASAQRDIRTGGRLDVLLRALELHDDPAVLLAPSAHLVEDLADQSAGFVAVERQEDGTRSRSGIAAEDEEARRAATTLRRLREVAEHVRHQPVTGPYADADLAGLLAHGGQLRELAGELATEGRSRLQRDLGRSVDASTFMVSTPISPETLDLMPSQHLLLRPEVLAAPPGDARLQQLRSPSGRPLTVSVGDPTISELLDDGGREGLVTAQRILAETAAAYFADPGVADRTISLHPPDDWDPAPDLAHALLEGLSGAPWLELVSTSQLVGEAERAPGTLELADVGDERFPHDVADRLSTALMDLQAAVDSWPETSEATPERSRSEMHTALLRSTSRLLDPAIEASALISDVQTDVDRFFGDVEVASGSQVTLTAETGQVPVTVRRTRGGPVTVRIEVQSQGRLVWDERRSDEIVLAGDEAHTVSFETRALSTGTFPVTVVVTDATGTRELERTTLRVRSTAVSGPALSATGALVLGLLLIGALRRRPRGRRLQVIDGAERRDTQQ